MQFATLLWEIGRKEKPRIIISYGMRYKLQIHSCLSTCKLICLSKTPAKELVRINLQFICVERHADGGKDVPRQEKKLKKKTRTVVASQEHIDHA